MQSIQNLQNEQLGGVYHGAGERESPPLPPAQLGDQPALQLLVPEMQHGEETRDLDLDVVHAEDAPIVSLDSNSSLCAKMFPKR